MKVVGLFRELGRGVNSLVPSIYSATDVLSVGDASLVAKYLRSGVVVFDVMETTIDPMDSSVRIDGGPSLVSDGEWVWRMDLAYFVEKYKVALPHDFLTHVREKVCVNSNEQSIISRWGEALSSYELAEQGIEK